LLAEYGFILPKNRYNYVTLQDPFTDVKHRDEFISILKAYGYWDKFVLDDEDVSFSLLNAMRLYLIFNTGRRQDDLDKWIQVQQGILEIVSPENEALTHKNLLEVIYSHIEEILRDIQAMEVMASQEPDEILKTQIKLCYLHRQQELSIAKSAYKITKN
jgi:hypothetical protein